MNNFEQFYNAASELDMLTIDGVFGQFALDMLEQRESLDTAEYCYKCLLDMFEEPQYGVENVIGIIFRLLKLYSDALNVLPQEPVDVLTAFLKGTEDHPELECLSSYSEFVHANVLYKNMVKELGSKSNVSNSEVRGLAASLLSTYSKGVELVGKAYTQLLTLVQIISNKPHDLYKNSLLSIYEKTKQYRELASDDYMILSDVIDRKIRNADAHLNAYFSVEKRCYVMKCNIKNGKKTKIEMFELSAEDMIKTVFPKVCWFVQGYMASCMLLILVFSDKEKYYNAAEYISRLNR